jgi:hypothetical protein
MRITATITLSLLLGTSPVTAHPAIFKFLPAATGGTFAEAAAGSSTGTPKEPPSTLSKFKDLADALHSVATVIALIVGGWWTYSRFIKKREKFPRAKISHSITHRKLDDDFQLLHVGLNVQNVGEVLLCLNQGFVRVQQVIPASPELLKALHARGDITDKKESECDWPLLGEHSCDWQSESHEMEPGEDENIEFDFAVRSDVKTVEVYSYFKNEKKFDREIGWNLTTLYDLEGTQTAEKLDHGPGKSRVAILSTETQT